MRMLTHVQLNQDNRKYEGINANVQIGQCKQIHFSY